MLAAMVVIKKLRLYLIKPSQYDDDGYVVRYWRGVLPSNTLACLAGLTEDLIEKKTLGQSLAVEMHLYDESVERLPLRRICRSSGNGAVKTVIALVGVQTAQFPRAADLARQFRRAGLTVMIGGFHVSGLLAMLPRIPADLQALMDEGVTLVKGEVEESWGGLLQDAIAGQLQPLYDFLGCKPDLQDKPLPIIRRKRLRRFAYPFGTLDCGRGCPFACGFCTIINVQGRTMRCRSVEQIVAAVRRNFREEGIRYYFFTDDNFARNREWPAIFQAFARLREAEQIPVEFMMQVDTLSWKIEGFVEQAQRAGCASVFIGMESLNRENLKAAGKRQNDIAEYRRLIETYRRAGISPHVGYILGFPADTTASVRRDLRRLIHQVQPDHASFFILMPLPGSQDHLEMWRRGEWMEPDFNRYDSTHEVTHHPHLPAGHLHRLYQEAWRTFYSFDNMAATLRRSPRRTYWNNLLRFAWYKNSIEVESRHPMTCGFFRRKNRGDIRPGTKRLSRFAYFAMRAREIRAELSGMARVFFEMEELWLQTRPRSQAEQFLAGECKKALAATRGRLRVADLQLAHLRARLQFPRLRVPSKWQLWWANSSPLLSPRRVYTRADLAAFWRSAWEKWQDRRWLDVSPYRLAFNVWRDLQLGLLFFLALARGYLNS